MIVPDILQQHRPRHHLAGVAHQVFEQLEFLRLQGDDTRAARGLPGQQVDMQVRDVQGRLLAAALHPAAQGIQAGQQLSESERLGEIVIATALQALDALVHVRQRAQDQDRGAVARLAQRLDDRQPVDVSRQHPVHDDDIVRLAGREKHAFAAVVRMVGGVAGLLQPFQDEARHPLVVLDQENLHPAPRTAGAETSRSASAAASAAARALRPRPSRSFSRSR